MFSFQELHLKYKMLKVLIEKNKGNIKGIGN